MNIFNRNFPGEHRPNENAGKYLTTEDSILMVSLINLVSTFSDGIS